MASSSQPSPDLTYQPPSQRGPSTFVQCIHTSSTLPHAQFRLRRQQLILTSNNNASPPHLDFESEASREEEEGIVFGVGSLDLQNHLPNATVDDSTSQTQSSSPSTNVQQSLAQNKEEQLSGQGSSEHPQSLEKHSEKGVIQDNFSGDECSDTDMDMSMDSEGDSTVSGGEAINALSQFDQADFECALCYKLFYQPVTTTCGHTYCKSCILSSLKYSPNCPLCRTKLFDSPRDCNYSVNYLLVNILEKHFGSEYKARESEEKQEEESPPAAEPEEWQPTCHWWGSCAASLGCVLMYPQ